MRGYHRLVIRRLANRHQSLTRDALARMTSDLLDIRIDSALSRFPFYKDVVIKHRGSIDGPITLQELPVWTREHQREFFDQQDSPPDSSYVHQTSGSTGLPVRFHITRASYEWRTAIMDRSYSWARAEEGQRSFYIWAGAQKAPPLMHRLKRALHLSLQRRTFFDAFRQFGEEERAQCCRMINRTRPTSIVGYTGMLVDLARFARDNPGALIWKPKTMVNAAEGLLDGQRELLENNLVDEVFLSYGSREFMNIAMECEAHNGYHIVTDNIVVEVVDDSGGVLPAGEPGRIVVTDLRNLATPFIRYEIGDYGTLATDEPCSCGRPFPRLLSIDGRQQDVIVAADGRKLTGLYITYLMRQFDWIDGYQVVQERVDKITIRLLTTVSLSPELEAPIRAGIEKKLGADMQVALEQVDELSRKANGKVELVISKLGTTD